MDNSVEGFKTDDFTTGKNCKKIKCNWIWLIENSLLTHRTMISIKVICKILLGTIYLHLVPPQNKGYLTHSSLHYALH